MLGIDEIVGLGYRNSVTVPQIKQFMVMDSQEEKDFRKKQDEKEKEVRKQMNEKMREIERMKRENKYVSDSVSSSKYINYY